jgi:hypothetical protein
MRPQASEISFLSATQIITAEPVGSGIRDLENEVFSELAGEFGSVVLALYIVHKIPL